MLSPLILYSCLQPTQFQIEISPRFGIDLILQKFTKEHYLYPNVRFFFLKRSLHVCVATSVFIGTNFKPALFSVSAHITPSSGLSQWSTISFAS